MEEQERPPGTGDEISISDEVLSALGIDRATVHHAQEQKRALREQVIALSFQQGTRLYSALRLSDIKLPISDIHIGGDYVLHLAQPIKGLQEGLDSIKESLDLPLEELILQVSREKGDVVEADTINLRLRAVLEGFGMTALRENRLDLGLDAINAGTEGGILQNKNALNFLKETHGANPLGMVEVAEKIEAIIRPKPPGPAASPLRRLAQPVQ